jgi:hypothetical protein
MKTKILLILQCLILTSCFKNNEPPTSLSQTHDELNIILDKDSDGDFITDINEQRIGSNRYIADLPEIIHDYDAKLNFSFPLTSAIYHRYHEEIQFSNQERQKLLQLINADLSVSHLQYPESINLLELNSNLMSTLSFFQLKKDLELEKYPYHNDFTLNLTSSIELPNTINLSSGQNTKLDLERNLQSKSLYSNISTDRFYEIIESKTLKTNFSEIKINQQKNNYTYNELLKSVSNKSYLLVISTPSATKYFYISKEITPIKALLMLDPKILLNAKGELDTLFGVKSSLQERLYKHEFTNENSNKIFWTTINTGMDLMQIDEKSNFVAIVATTYNEASTNEIWANTINEFSFNRLNKFQTQINLGKSPDSNFEIFLSIPKLSKIVTKTHEKTIYDDTSRGYPRFKSNAFMSTCTYKTREIKSSLVQTENDVLTLIKNKLLVMKNSQWTQLDPSFKFQISTSNITGKFSIKISGKTQNNNLRLMFDANELYINTGVIKSNCSKAFGRRVDIKKKLLYPELEIYLEAHTYQNNLTPTSSPSSM